MRIRMSALIVTAAFGLVTLGCGKGGGGGLPGVSDKDYVTDAEQQYSRLKADYVVLFGILDIAENKIDGLTAMPEFQKLGKVKWAQFHGELKGCWEAPIESIKGAKANAYDIASAAKALQSKAVFGKVATVKDHGASLIKTVKGCPQMAADKVTGFPKKTKDEVLTWAREKLALVNDIRVLFKQTVPDKAKALKTTAVDVPAKIAGLAAQAVAHAKVVSKNPLASSATKNKANAQVQQLKRMQTDAAGFGKKIVNDMKNLPARLQRIGTKVGTNITSVGKK